MASELSALSLFTPRTNVDEEGRSLLTSGEGPQSAARTSTLAAANVSISHETLDLVQLSGSYSSGSTAQADNGAITFNSDGTYNVSALMIHQETFQLEASFMMEETQEAGDSGLGDLRNLMNDVRDAFRSILDQLRDGLAQNQQAPQGARMVLPGLQQSNPFSDTSLSSSDKELLQGYLALLRHFAEEFGSNPAIDRAIASLEEFLGDEGAEAGAETQVQSAQSLQININVEVTNITQVNVSFGANGQEVQQGDPLVIDLDGDGVEVSDLSQGVQFDLNGDGAVERTAFASDGDGVLVLDRNGDGRINNGRELFGDQNGAAHGFAELSRYDDNRDRVIDSSDSIYSQLRVWADSNRDGISQASELRSLQDLNIRSLNLNWQNDNRGVNGNRIAQSSSYTRNDGTQSAMADVLLNYIG